MLMGVGMKCFFDSRRKLGWSPVQILRYFFLRGFVFLLLEILVYNGNYSFFRLVDDRWSGWSIDLSALWALGWSMIIGALVLMLQICLNEKSINPNWPRLSGRGGDMALVFLIFLINITTELLIPSQRVESNVNEITAILFISRVYPYPDPSPDLFVQYPILPWFSVVLIGFLLAQPLREKDSQVIGRVGVLLVAIFVFLRLAWFYDIFDFGNLRQKPTGDEEAWNSYYGFFLSL